MQTVLVDQQSERLTEFINENTFIEHNPRLADNVSSLRAVLEAQNDGARMVDYQKIHRVLAQGNFVLCVSEGNYGGVHTSYYDLFRLADSKVVEHWDTTEMIAPQCEWKNSNGKF